ncbi:MAG: chromosome segregation protein SMC [bacterium]|nr:chromosome segregation protein SMC [bacterium]MDE0668157.1 chromosome segregation protein SMC [bacterium]
MASAAETQPSGETDWPYGGARWWKFDFHTHTPASRDYGKGPDRAAERSISPRDWLRGFMGAGVDCVAVTDHNSGEWVDPLKASLAELAAQPCRGYRPLWLFPGVEITANGGTHILAVLDPSKSSADVDNLIGCVGFRGARGASDTTADCSAIEVIEAIHKAGGVAIPAHVDGERGLWGLSGNTLDGLLRSDKIFAAESSGTVEAPAKHDRPTRYDELGVRWADVLGSDCHRPHVNSPSSQIGDRFTWVKMAEPSLEGLRLALLDGDEYSVRRSLPSGSFDPPELPQHHLRELSISDARFMGRAEAAKVAFSPWLNAIVGGRGTGKSTIVHALRIVARRSSELQTLDDSSSAKRTFARFDRVPKSRFDEGGLSERTVLSLVAVRDGVSHRIRWRQDPAPTSGEAAPVPTVEELTSGSWAASEVQAVSPARFPLRIFSQGQLAELADGNQQALLQIIDEAAGTAVQQAILVQATAAFLQTRGRIRDLDQHLKRRADTQVSIADTERKLRRFDDSGHAEVLTSYRHRSRQRQEVDRHFEVVTRAAELIESTAGQVLAEDVDARFFSEDSPENLSAVSAIASLAEATARAASELKRTAADLRAEAEAERSSLARSQWHTAVDEAKAAYQRMVEALGADGISSPSEYGRLIQERSRLEGELAALESQAEERSRLIERSEQELETVFEARCALSEERRAFLRQTLDGNEFVRMELREFGDSGSLEAVERSLRSALGDEDHFENDVLHVDGDERSGIVVDLVDALPSERAERRHVFKHRIEDLRRRFTEACMGRGEFGGHLNNFLERRHDEAPEFLDRLLTWIPDDSLRVEYDRSGRGSEFAPIAQASAGQRAAAMLAFLLAHGDEPLVLDQPEDDLDNHLIYDLVVRQIRQNKLRRQIIAVTHNPNIVVNGDAEMVHALDFVGGQCRVVKSGSLQDLAIRDEICRVMEGGREALERRYRRIAVNLSDV